MELHVPAVALPTPWWDVREREMTLCRHCSAATKPSLCYQCCFQHNSTRQLRRTFTLPQTQLEHPLSWFPASCRCWSLSAQRTGHNFAGNSSPFLQRWPMAVHTKQKHFCFSLFNTDLSFLWNYKHQDMPTEILSTGPEGFTCIFSKVRDSSPLTFLQRSIWQIFLA